MDAPDEVGLRALHELRDLLDGLPHPLWVADPHGRLLLVNRAFEAAFGATNPGERDERVLCAPDSSAAGSDGARASEMSLLLDGVETCWLVVRWPLRCWAGRRAEGGEPAALAGIATDITRQRQAQRQLRELHGNREQHGNPPPV